MTKLEFVNLDNPDIAFSGSTEMSQVDVVATINSKATFRITNEVSKVVFLITPAFMEKYLCVITTNMVTNQG